MLSPFRAKRRKLGKKKERRVGLLSVSRSTVLSLHRVRKGGQKMQKKKRLLKSGKTLVVNNLPEIYTFFWGKNHACF